jgi:competence protein ComEC
MNTIVSGVSHFPCTTAKGISISTLEALILFLIIVFIYLFFSSQRKYYFISALSVLAIFFMLRVGEKIVHSRQQIMEVYNIPGKSAVSFISGQHSLMPFSRVDSNDIDLHIQYNWWKLGVQDNLNIHSDTNATLLSGMLMMQKHFVQFNNCRIAFIKQNADVPSSSSKINLHCVVVSGSYDLDMLSLKNAFNFDTLIFDSSVPEYKLKEWEAECQQLNLHYYNVKAQGAYIEKVS